MNKELELESFNAEVLSKYAGNSEKYTIEKDNVVKPNNRAWIIKYYIMFLSKLSILCYNYAWKNKKTLRFSVKMRWIMKEDQAKELACRIMDLTRAGFLSE